MTVRRVLGLVVALAATLVGLAVPAHAVPAPQAATCSGVWVVVDYGALGGTSTSCATSFSTGTAALRSAGFGLTLDSGMIVKINGVPATVNVQDHYWSYWHATLQPDGSYSGWSYSGLGANAYHPTAGNAEGWRYQALADGYVAPGAAPPRKVATTTAPATTVPAPATTKAAVKTTAVAAATTATGAADATTATPAPSGTTSETPTPSATSDTTVSLAPSAGPGSASPAAAVSGPQLSSVIGGIVAILVVAVASVALAIWRKRTTDRR